MNERAAQSVLNRLAEGVSEEDLAQHFLECTAKEGAVFEFWNTASGTQSSMTIMSYGHHHSPGGVSPEERRYVPVRRGKHLQQISFRCRGLCRFRDSQCAA